MCASAFGRLAAAALQLLCCLALHSLIPCLPLAVAATNLQYEIDKALQQVRTHVLLGGLFQPALLFGLLPACCGLDAMAGLHACPLTDAHISAKSWCNNVPLITSHQFSSSPHSPHPSPCQVLDRVGEAQAAAGSGAPGRVTFEGCSSTASEPLPELDMYRPVSSCDLALCSHSLVPIGGR